MSQVEAELLQAPIVLTQEPEPYGQIRGTLPASAQVVLVTDIDHAETIRRTDAFTPGATAVIGVGGGMALDHAKFSAWRLKLPLILCPSILSVDAAYTRAVGVREDGCVRYVGDDSSVLRAILIDSDLLQSAPAVLNRAGAGDILSCYTALWDWKESAEQLGEEYDELLAEETRTNCLQRLYAHATDIQEQSDLGLRVLSELFVEEVRLCEQWGNARLEEGSEHYLGYALEAKTGKHYIHGQLIGMCIVLTAGFQGQDTKLPVKCLKDIGLDCSFTVRHVLVIFYYYYFYLGGVGGWGGQLCVCARTYSVCVRICNCVYVCAYVCCMFQGRSEG